MQKKISLVLIYLFIGIFTRTIWHIGPNVEFITGLGIASGYFFSKGKYISCRNFILTSLIPLSIMLITDWVIGNTIIYLFTWSAFLVGPFFGILIKKTLATQKFKNNIKKKVTHLIISTEIVAITSTLFFFFWTNFGVVLVSSMYPKNISGVIQSYINALPFLENQLIGNLILVPGIFLFSYIYLNISFYRLFNFKTKGNLNKNQKIKNLSCAR